MSSEQLNIYFSLMFTLCVILRTPFTTGLNITELIRQYTNVCGFGYTCFDRVKSHKDYSEYQLCPKCSCEDSCFQKRNCCPDKYFSKPYSVYKSIIITKSENAYKQFQKYAIVDSCPFDSDSVLKSMCEKRLTPSELFVNPPVTSNLTNISYSNENCAFCNKESQGNLGKWILSIGRRCGKQVFYMSSYEDIIKVTENTSCNVIYDPGYIRNLHKVRKSDLHKSHECNVSGTMIHMNKDIVKGCRSSYDLPYRKHVNIFCAMCNPPKGTRKIIGTCNNTGEWIEYDEQVEKACIDNPMSELTYPFKNAYCYLCNMKSYNSLLSRYSRTFNDYTAIIGEKVSDQYYIKIANIETRKDVLWEQIASAKVENITEKYKHGMINRKGIAVNVTHLLMKMMSFRNASICDKSLLPDLIQNVTTGNCLCDYSCVFEKPCECCLDIALSYPVMCISDRLNHDDSKTDDYTFVVTDGCYRKDGRYDGSPHFSKVRRLCENDTELKVSFPVSEKSYFSKYRVSYKNVYCFLCNNGFTLTNDSVLHDRYYPWNLNLICSEEIPYAYMPKLTDLLALGREKRCKIIFDTDYATACKTKNKKESKKCKLPLIAPTGLRNVSSQAITGLEKVSSQANSGFKNVSLQVSAVLENVSSPVPIGVIPNVSSIDRDVVWACEISHYGQFFDDDFCDVCYSYKVDRNQCNKRSLYYSDFFQKSCALMPEVPMYYPHKNLFCRACDIPCGLNCPRYVVGKTLCESSIGKSIDGTDSVVNDLFNLGIMSTPSLYTNQEEQNFACYPGKFLSNGKCRSLLSNVIDVTYGLNFKCEINISTSSDFNVSSAFELAHKLLTSVSSNIQATLQNYFQNLGFQMKKYFFLPFIQTANISDFSVHSHHAILFTEIRASIITDRFLAEKKLLSLPSSFKIQNRSVWINSLALQNKINSTFSIKGIGITNPPVLQNWPYLFRPKYMEYKTYMEKLFFFTPLKLNHVTKLLFCKQLVFKTHDFIINNKTLAISTNHANRNNETFRMGQFVFGLDGSVHVCYEPSITGAKTGDVILGLYTRICIIVSLCCLLFSFITYFVNPQLRTIPGKNLMNLIFAMFCAQFFFLFTKRVKDDVVTCSSFGVVQHYCWLVTCCCWFICCFHTYRVFTGRGFTQAGLQFSEKTFIYYCLFSYLLPLLIVSLNMLILWSTTGNVGYGTKVCFIENATSLIITFVVPLCLTCIVNTFMFIRAARAIASSTKIRKATANEMKILVRLFSITGIVWMVQIVDGFIQYRPLSYVATTLTCLQGCFIFISYCCKRQILKLWKKNVMAKLSGTSLYRQWSRSTTVTSDGSRQWSTKISFVSHLWSSKRSNGEHEESGHQTGQKHSKKNSENDHEKYSINTAGEKNYSGIQTEYVEQIQDITSEYTRHLSKVKSNEEDSSSCIQKQSTCNGVGLDSIETICKSHNDEKCETEEKQSTYL